LALQVEAQKQLPTPIFALPVWHKFFFFLNYIMPEFVPKADLRDIDLRDYSLAGLDLKNTDWRDALLVSVDFKGADLTDADFRDAVLVDCDFTNAIMIHKTLIGSKQVRVIGVPSEPEPEPTPEPTPEPEPENVVISEVAL
jgi:hypothetical protein